MVNLRTRVARIKWRAARSGMRRGSVWHSLIEETFGLVQACEADLAREKFFVPESDHLTLLNVYNQWKKQ